MKKSLRMKSQVSSKNRTTLAQATAINEALVISGMRQHELTEVAVSLNEQLRKEIAERILAETALHEANDKLAAKTDALEHLVAERTQKLRETIGELDSFSYSVKHDLRAPLRAMQGYATSLLEEYTERLDDTGKTYLERMARSAIRMDNLIQDVLSYTKILRADVELEPVDLNALIHDVIQMHPDWQPPIAKIQIKGNLPEVFGNEALLVQCVSILLDNATKFVAKGTRPDVMIWAEAVDNDVRLWIKDNGIGIDPKHFKRIFRMFEQLRPDNKYNSTGIGLAIARKAVERMGGRIEVESQLGAGSSFWIELKNGQSP